MEEEKPLIHGTRRRYWVSCLLFLLACYLLKSATSLNLSASLILFSLMEVALAFIRRRLRFSGSKPTFSWRLGFFEEISLLTRLGSQGPTRKFVSAAVFGSSRLVLLVIGLSWSDLSTAIIASALSIDFLSYIAVCTLEPAKFFHVSKALGCVGFLSALLIIWANFSFSLALVLCLASVCSFLELKALRDASRAISLEERNFLSILHAALKVPFVLFVWFNMVLYQRGIGSNVFSTAFLVILASSTLQFSSSQRALSNTSDEDFKSGSIYMSFLSIPLFLLTQDKSYLFTPASIGIFFFFALGRYLLNYRDVIEFYTDQSLPLNIRRSLSQATKNEANFQNFIAHVRANPKARHLSIFIILNLIYMFVEFAYGLSSNSLSLISDAVHMLFDSLSLMMGLYVTFMSTFASTAQYSYGFGRAEIMSGFINAIFLIFVAFYILLESIERILEPEEIRSGGLLLVSVLGLIINLIGLKFFHEHAHGGTCSHAHHDHSHSEDTSSHNGCSHNHDHSHHHHDHHEHHDHHGHSHSKQDENIEGVFLHILADTCGSVGVIFSALMVKYFNITIIDPIVSICIVVLILMSIMPLLKSSSLCFLEASENSIYEHIAEKLKKIEGVLEVRDLHIWRIKGDSRVGSVRLRVGMSREMEEWGRIQQEGEIVLQNNDIQRVSVSTYN